MKIAASNPNKLKFKSNDEHNAKPIIIGIKLKFVHTPVISPINTREIITVKRGEDDLTVSTNDIVLYLSATNPNMIDVNL